MPVRQFSEIVGITCNIGGVSYLCDRNYTTYMKTTTTATAAYESPRCRVVEIGNSEILCISTNTESYNSGSNAWTQNNGEDESFFNN